MLSSYLLYFVFVAFFIEYGSCESVIEAISHLNDNVNTTKEVSEHIFRSLDNIENSFTMAWKWTQIHREILRTIMGAILLFYGGNFSNTILLIQSLSLGSLENFGLALNELSQSYKQSRKGTIVS